MRIKQRFWRRSLARLPKTSATLIKITCLQLLSGVGLFLSAQIMTREDLQEQIGVYERAFWPMQVALVLVIVPQVAVRRGWPVWLRLLLHAGWIVLVVYARLQLGSVPSLANVLR